MTQNNIITCKQKFLLWLNRLRFSIRFRRSGRFLEIIISEKYKRVVRTLKLVATTIGLFSAFIAFQSTIIAFLFGLGIFTLISFIERIFFSYTNSFIQPMPEFEIENKKWLGSTFGFARSEGNPHDIPVVGMILEDKEYAEKIYSLLMSWTNDKINDVDHHVKISVVILDDNNYVLFVYPSMKRKPAEDFFNLVEEERKIETPKDIPLRLYAQLILGKRCEITGNSYFPDFRNRYKVGVPFLFQLCLLNADGKLEQFEGIPDLIFHNLKIVEKGKLTRKDIEYDMVRIFG